MRGSSARIGQVFLNLILNAAHALPEGERRRNRIWVRSFDEGGSVVVEVEDNGPGIAAEVMPRIFDSFFTTKPAGRGHRAGAVHLPGDRAVGRRRDHRREHARAGARCSGCGCPPPPRSRPRRTIARPTPTPTRRRYRLLAIDDEMLLLKAYRRMLIDHHDIEVAAGGAEALAAAGEGPPLRRHPVRPADARACRAPTSTARWPSAGPGLEQRFIVITGGAFSPEARKFLEEGIVTAVNKPFQLEEILDVVDRRAAALRR